MRNDLAVLHIKGDLTGGSTTVTCNYAKELKSKITYDWLLLNSRAILSESELKINKEIAEIGGTTYFVPLNQGLLERLFYLYRFFKQHKYKIIHVDTDNPTRWRIMLIAKLAGVPTRIMHSHSTLSEAENMKNVSESKKKKLQTMVRLTSTDYFACSSDAGVYLFGEKGVASQKFHVIRNGINVSAYQYDVQIRNQIRQAETVKEDTVVLGFVGRMVAVKNLPFLLDVYEEYHRRCPNSLLWLIGDGQLREQIEKDVQQRGLQPTVKFWGSCGNVNYLIQAIDALLLPSVFEGFPMVVVEAQTSGLPVFVSTGVPAEAGLTEQFHAIPLVDGAATWAAEIETALKNYRRADFSGIIRAKGYDISSTAEWMYSFYKSKIHKD